MKKQIKKLNLNKRTISNLNSSEMNKHVGGNPTNGNGCATNQGCSGICSIACTQDCASFLGTCQGHTCHGNKCN